MKPFTLFCMLVSAALLFAAPVWAEESMNEAESAEQSIDMSKMTCKQLMMGDDTDRETGFAFYHGFLAGKANNALLDITAAAILTEKVKDYCLSNPTSTVMDAFMKSKE